MRFLIFSFLILFSIKSYSADYSWYVGNNTVGAPIFSFPSSSPSKSCSALLSSLGYTQISLTKLDEVTYRCNIRISSNATGSAFIGRKGDSCPDAHIYDPELSECIPPPVDCSSSAGTTGYHLSATGKTRPSPESPWPDGLVTGSPTMCSGSCQYSMAQSTIVKCGSLKYGDPLIQYCLFKYSGTGQSCDAGDPAQNNGSTDPVPPTDPNDPTDPANNCGPTHVWSGTTCVPKLDPDPADPTDPGTGGTDPGTGGGGPGTGGGDPGTGGGDPGTGGGDPGSGGGDPGDDGPDDEGDPVKGEACDLDLTCEGDAIQCAMLRQQKTDRCNWELNEKNMKQITDSFTGDKYELGESTTDIGLSFNSALSSPRFLPSGCPAPQRITIQGRSYSLTWAYVCDFASGLSYVIVALAGLFFVVYVGRGFGGD